MADVDLNAPVVQAQNNTSQLKNLFGTQQADTSNFLNKFGSTIAGQEGTSAIAARIGSELGIDKLRSNAQSLQNTLFNIPQTYSKATTGFDVNSNQLARLVGQKESEIAPAAGLAQSNLQGAENTLNTRMGYEQRDQDRALLPLQSEQSLLSDRMARETSGYTQAMTGELDAIIQKMEAGIQVSEGEKNRAHQLAVAEQGYKNQLSLQKQQQESQKAENPYVSLGEGTTLFNTQTGKPVYKTGKTAVPQSGNGNDPLGLLK